MPPLAVILSPASPMRELGAAATSPMPPFAVILSGRGQWSGVRGQSRPPFAVILSRQVSAEALAEEYHGQGRTDP